MKKLLQSAAIVALLLTIDSILNTVFAQSTVLTYQGQVLDKGVAFTGTGQFEFALVTSTNNNHQATATVTTSGGFVTIINVVSGGSGYTTAPTVTISGGSGSGAAATANLTGGVVTSYTVNNPGSGYTGTPTVTVAPPPANLNYTTYWSNDGTSVNGSQPAAPVSLPVASGLFTAALGDTNQLNMTAVPAAVFASQPDLQLRIWFNDGVNGFAALSPLQNLTTVPYAVQALNATSASNLLGSLNLASLPAAVITNNATGANINGTFSGNGGSLANVNAQALNGLNSTNFWQLGGNNVAPGQILGSTNSQPLEVHVNNLRALLITGSPTDSPNINGGAAVNTIDPGLTGGVIAGGGTTNVSSYTLYYVSAISSSNHISGNFDFIGSGSGNWLQAGDHSSIVGGIDNLIGQYGYQSFIGGGFSNTIQSALYYGTDLDFIGCGWFNTVGGDDWGCVIAGGGTNTIGTYSYECTIGGGYENYASGSQVTVGGGNNNTASGQFSTVPGGSGNIASGTAATAAGYGNQATNNGAVVAGGGNNIAGGFNSSIVGGAYNTVTIQGGAIGGGYYNTNTGLYATIPGGYENLATNTYATAGGGAQNVVGGNGATIAGGQQNSSDGSSDHTAIGGGWYNTISSNDYEGTIAGGYYNAISDIYNGASYAAIGGGQYNTNSSASGVVAGGQQNLASGNVQSTVGGGYNNTASGNYATVPGGFQNIASGVQSFAAGTHAQAVNQGAFVWGDSQGGNFASTANNQFLIRSGGGVGINMNNPNGASLYAAGNRSGGWPNSVGVFENTSTVSNNAPALRVTVDGGNPLDGALSVSADIGTSTRGIIAEFGNSTSFVVVITNDGTIYSKGVALTSDRNMKANFTKLDAQNVLAKVAAMPVTQWNYKEDSTEQRHIGPMAQDFHAAFGLNGGDDRHISVVDEGGVALAAIQGLNQKLETENAELKAELAELKAEVKQLAQAQQK